MLERRSYGVGTCHGMSPKAMLMRGVAAADMPWHVPTAMRAFLMLVTLGGAAGREETGQGVAADAATPCVGVFGSGGITC